LSILARWRKRPAAQAKEAVGAGGELGRLRVLFSWKLALLAIPVCALVVLHLVLFPPARGNQSIRLDVGSISDQEILAPFSFTAPRPSRELEIARRDASQRVEPVYRVLEGAELRVEQRMKILMTEIANLAEADSVDLAQRAELLDERYPDIPQSTWRHALQAEKLPLLRESVERTTRRYLSAGVVDVTPRGTYQQIRLLDANGGVESMRPVSSVVLGYRLEERLQEDFRAELGEHAAVEAASNLALSLLVPNLSYDDAETERRRESAAEAVADMREYARNERILQAGDRVELDDLEILAALESARARRELAQDRSIGARLRVGRVLLILALLASLGLLLRQRDRHMLSTPSEYLLLAILLALHISLAALVLRHPMWGGATAVPVVLLAMLATILFGHSAGPRITTIGILLLAIVADISGLHVALWGLVAGVATREVRHVRHRNQFYRAMGMVSVGYIVGVTGLVFASGEGMTALGSELLRVLSSGIASTALCLFLLPLFEALFGITTELTILELADLNHPLLKRMSLESPGTYHHSQVVGTLAEAGARAIGGNGLLARVGANFHDIGKMLKPRYYAENQSETNAHDELTPSMSALVIAAHVKDGIELGRQWGLPREVLAYIPEHHGTSVMHYFYKKALKSDDAETVKVDDFRYPGPKPRSRETAVVMLADGVEASVRSLRRVTPSRVREMVRRIIDKRMAEGELDECSLSLSDLAKIREAFVPILVGIHHQRVAYPGQRAHEEKKEKESIEARSRARRSGTTMATGG